MRGLFTFGLVISLFCTTLRAETTAVAALLRRGVALRLSQQDEAALSVFVAAWEQCHCGEARAQMGLAEHALSRFSDAETHITEALADTTDSWVRRNRRELEDALGSISTHLGVVLAECTDDHATVWLDDALVGTVEPGHPLRVRTNEGQRQLRLDRPGGRGTTQTVILRPGSESRIACEPLAPAPPPMRALTSVRTPDPAAGRMQRTTIGTIASGIVLMGGAVAAQVLQQDFVRAYNDDTHCLAGGRTRDTNCGATGRSADIAEAFAVAGFVSGTALLSVGVGVWLGAGRTTTATHVVLRTCSPWVGFSGIACDWSF